MRLRHLAIGGPLHVPGARAGGGEDALELDAGHHVGEAAVAQLVLAPGIELVKAGGQEDGTYFDDFFLFTVIRHYRLGLTDVGASLAVEFVG